MNPLVIVKIETEYIDGMHGFPVLRWVCSMAYHEKESDPFLVYKTGNDAEAQNFSQTMAQDVFGYREDEIEIRHLY